VAGGLAGGHPLVDPLAGDLHVVALMRFQALIAAIAITIAASAGSS
jgi:hypothetical protein